MDNIKELSNDIKKRFIKDFSLPIQLFQEQYFDYFVNLYDDIYSTKKKLNLLFEVLNNEKIQNQSDFFNYSEKISSGVMSIIQNSKAYSKMNECNVDNEFKLLKEIPQKNIYSNENVGFDFISIDLKKSKFQ